eukprot:2553922-Rhodomonas_salina.3
MLPIRAAIGIILTPNGPLCSRRCWLCAPQTTTASSSPSGTKRIALLRALCHAAMDASRQLCHVSTHQRICVLSASPPVSLLDRCVAAHACALSAAPSRTGSAIGGEAAVLAAKGRMGWR